MSDSHPNVPKLILPRATREARSGENSTVPSPTNSVISTFSMTSSNSTLRRRRRKKGVLTKAKKSCADCDKKRKGGGGTTCAYHRFSQVVLGCPESDLGKIKQVFIEICYDREFNTFNIVQFVSRMLRTKNGLRKRSKEFVDEVCKFAMMGVRGKTRGTNSYVAPDTIAVFLKNSKLPFHLYRHHLTKEHFPQCVKNGYPIQDSLNACYGEKLSKSLNSVIEPIQNRYEDYLRALPTMPGSVCVLILSYLD